MNTDTIIINHFVHKQGNAAARALNAMEPEKLAAYFDESSIELLLVIIPLMDPLLMASVFEKMQMDKIVQLFESFEIQYTVLFMRIMKKDLEEKILGKLALERSGHIRRLLKYVERSVGSNMDPAVFTLRESMTVKEARAEARKHKNNINPDLFVLTSGRKLIGAIKLSDLLSRDPETEIRHFMNTKFITFPPETPVQSVLNIKEWEDFYSLPVVDPNSLFLGVIRLETMRSIQIKADKNAEDLGQNTIKALGELYQIGLAGLVKGAIELKPGSFNE